MASMLFTEPPEGLSLKEAREAIVTATTKLDDERTKMDVVLFANVYVGPILVTPGTKETSFLVSYSDKDFEAPELVVEVLKRLVESRRRNLLWFPRRDPYCA